MLTWLRHLPASPGCSGTPLDSCISEAGGEGGVPEWSAGDVRNGACFVVGCGAMVVETEYVANVGVVGSVWLSDVSDAFFVTKVSALRITIVNSTSGSRRLMVWSSYMTTPCMVHGQRLKGDSLLRVEGTVCVMCGHRRWINGVQDLTKMHSELIGLLIVCNLKEGQSGFLIDFGKVRACSEACGFSTSQEDSQMAHGEELMENRRMNGHIACYSKSVERSLEEQTLGCEYLLLGFPNKLHEGLLTQLFSGGCPGRRSMIACRG